MSIEVSAYELDALSAGWDPFSRETPLWHACPAHEWERFDFDIATSLDEAPRVERVTRCNRCGAPRCDSYNAPASRADAPDAVPARWADLTDHERQRHRCTLERHHSVAHDFLDGTEIEVGG